MFPTLRHVLFFVNASLHGCPALKIIRLRSRLIQTDPEPELARKYLQSYLCLELGIFCLRKIYHYLTGIPPLQLRRQGRGWGRGR